MTVAFVTGATRGIGAATALALARDGYDLVITGRTVHEGDGMWAGSTAGAEAASIPGSLERTAADIEALGRRAVPVVMDLTDRASVEAAADAALAAFGRLDVVVLNAIYQGPGAMTRVVDLTLEQAERQLIGNYLHQIVLVQRLLPALLETSGILINMTSPTATVDPNRPAGEGGWGVAYAASKAAFHRLAGVLHVEHPELRVYNLDPGHVITEGQKVSAARAGREPTGDPPAVPAETIAWLVRGGEAQLALNGKVAQSQAICRRLGLVPGWS